MSPKKPKMVTKSPKKFVGSGSPSKPRYGDAVVDVFKRKGFTPAQAFGLAALSASVAILLTSILCVHFLSGGTNGAPTIMTAHQLRAIARAPQRGGLMGASSTGFSNMRGPLMQHSIASSTNEDGPWPKVAWLMSFPNSGTSFTLHALRTASNTTTATNYALEGDVKDKPSIPIHEKATYGPFLELINDMDIVKPTKYILTKTHCSGFCTDCLNFVETPRSFEVSCRSGMKAVYNTSSSPQQSQLIKHPVTYDQSLVAKAIHVIRHPLDNVVARFHLEYNTALAKKDPSWQDRFPNNSTGFKAWCFDMNRVSKVGGMRLIDTKLKIMMSGIPCGDEFYRYVQWHNLAFAVSQARNIPTLVVDYQDYQTNVDGIIDRILDFVELERKGEMEPFHAGKTYESFYTRIQRKRILAFVQEFASADTWRYLARYKM